MKCPACKSDNPNRQEFCGLCGCKLEIDYPKFPGADPPKYRFCGQCGSDLATSGNITIARSGLITQIDHKALQILGYREDEIIGKSFPLFVERKDLVIFFSHLNDLISSAKKQSFEISLKHKHKNNIYVLLEGDIGEQHSSTAVAIHLSLSEVIEQRQAAVQLQAQQDLLGLMFSVTHNISTAGEKHLVHSIEDALKKICLYSKADLVVVWGIKPVARYLEPLYQWRQTEDGPSQGTIKVKSVALSKIKHVVLKLRQEKTIVVEQLTELPAQEQVEMLAWQREDVKAAICYMIYAGKMPVGIICATRQTDDEGWTAESAALIQFFGNFISNRLPRPEFDLPRKGKPSSIVQSPKAEIKPRTMQRGNPIVADEALLIEPTGSADLTAEDSWQILTDASSSMLFDRFSGGSTLKQQAVVPREDGLVLITCPKCGQQETVTFEQLQNLGNAVTVECPCREKFAAVIEKRRAFRKRVHLDGYFSKGKGFGVGDAASEKNLWGQMVVMDLSKNGLRFSTEKADLINSGDLLMVRFNLDNSNRAPIHKTVRVISVSGFEVGGQFEGADNYDITLGFYFM
jgi:hypothetical protein